MKMYETKSWTDKITEVEVERATSSSIWINGRMSRKRSDWKNYFDSKQEAIDYQIECCKKDIEINDNKIRTAQESNSLLREKLDKLRNTK